MAFRYTKLDLYNPKPLQSIRRKVGLTQRDIADALGCTEVTIRNYEHGRTLPSGEYIDLMHRLVSQADFEPAEFYEITAQKQALMQKAIAYFNHKQISSKPKENIINYNIFNSCPYQSSS